MIQRVLLHYHFTYLNCIALILFLLVFAAAVVWVFRSESEATYKSLERLPFEDQDHG